MSSKHIKLIILKVLYIKSWTARRQRVSQIHITVKFHPPQLKIGWSNFNINIKALKMIYFILLLGYIRKRKLISC
jgi:hypothetical protein